MMMWMTSQRTRDFKLQLVEEFQTLTVQNSLSKAQSLLQLQHTMSHLDQSKDQWLDQINQ